MKDFKRGCYHIEPAEDGDVTLHLYDDYASAENLFIAALEFLYERPEYYLGTWIDHPEIKNVLYAAYSSGGRMALRFHTKENIATNTAVDGYVYLNHATFQRVLHAMIKSANDLNKAATRED
jgi:hypothetical protein